MVFGMLEDWPLTPLVYRAPVDGEIVPEPAGDTLAEALPIVVGHLATIDCSAKVMIHDGQRVTAAATLFAISPGNVLVIGVSELAEQVRELLASPEGITGWHHVTLPATRTPVHHLQPWLRPQSYNLLTRNQFATVEETAAMPDRCWTELRGAGPKFVVEVRKALAAHDAEHVDVSGAPARSAMADPLAAGDVDARRGFLAEQLTRAAVLRNALFVEQLAASALPQPVLAAICQALNAEPLPPTEPTTLLVLQTAGDPALLDTYRTTHDLSSGQPHRGVTSDLPAPVWTVELAEEILRNALPTASTLLRALIEEGGTATAEQLRSRLGIQRLSPMRQTLSTAAARVFSRRGFDRSYRHVVQARPDPNNPRSGGVHEYVLPAPLVPVFDQALRQLNR